MTRLRRILIGCALATASPLLAQTTWTANPVADAFVTTGPSNNLTANNYGGQGSLEISGSTATRTSVGPMGIFDTVMRFDLAGARTTFDTAYGAGLWTVQSISLRLSTSAATGNAIFNTNSTGQFSVVWMQNDSWAEGTGAVPADGITYATLPGFLSLNDQAAGTFTFDTSVSGGDGTNSTYPLSLGSGLTGDALAGSMASFELLAATNGVSYLVNSSNFGTAGRRPLLTVTAIAVPEPSTWWMLSAGLFMLVISGRIKRAPLPLR